MKKEVKILAIIAVVVVIGAVIGAGYYRNSVQNVRVTSNTSNPNSSQPTIPPEVLIRPDSPTLGPKDAPVAVVEFVDPECESCAAFAPILKKVVNQSGGRAKLVIRYMPLHPNSIPAANFLESAAEQGKYWEAKEYLFQKQPEWGTRHGPPTGAPQPDVPKLLDKYAKDLGLDAAKVSAAIKENRFQSKIDRDKRDGQTLGVRQTPTIFVNGRRLMTLTEAGLRALIEDESKN